MKPKEFQEATVRAVIRAFQDKGATRRFLVADEPGLGKTFVARRVLSELAGNERLTVLYVCSSQAIAGQNVDQLLGELQADQRAAARASADRPGLLPLAQRPTHPGVRIYSLTPGTAFSSAKRRNRGRVQERAFACALIEHEAGQRLDWLRACLAWNARNFEELLLQYRANIRQRLERRDREFARFVREFRQLVSECLAGHRGQGSYQKLQNAAAAHGTHAPLFITGLCRNCLAAAALTQLDPGLVIFDEFQRFRDLTTDDFAQLDPAETRIRSILTAKYDGRLLLLSATPYEALRPTIRVKKPTVAQAGQDLKAPPDDKDFYRLLDFLWGNRPKAERVSALRTVRTAFSTRESEIRRGVPNSDAAKNALEDLVQALSRVMCRTERPLSGASGSCTGVPTSVPLNATDVRSFRSFANWIGHTQHAHWTVPLWSSVPLAPQVLGNRYVCWKQGPQKLPPAELRTKHLLLWRLPDWSNPKARGLLQLIPRKKLAAPWVRPTCAWWPLAGVWAGDEPDTGIDGKALVFSRFAAVPGAVSAVLSYSLEAQLYQRAQRRAKPKYEAGTKPSFQRGGGSPAMFRLFFVSEFLAQLDPLRDGVPSSPSRARKVIADQLRTALAKRGTFVKRRLRRRIIPVEAWLIYLACGSSPGSLPPRSAWIDAVTDEEGGVATRAVVGEAFDRFRTTLPESEMAGITEKEFAALVQLALDSPAVVLARAVMRHWRRDGEWPDWDEQVNIEDRERAGVRSSATPRQLLQELAIGGLRRYLDRPWFAATLQRRSHKNFPEALHHAVVEGNFESVLDEHFWFISATNSQSWPKRLRELQAALALTGGRTVLHEATKQARKSRVRCNVALPLHQAKDEESEDVPRPDIVRHAFNTPFWPMVLTTTSVGQEGLDFHPWCKTVAHWDPAPGPVELEQREGRVSRYAGLFIRRALGVRYGSPLTVVMAGSPWAALAARAEADAAQEDESGGMSPWWCTNGASTTQLYLYCAGSRESALRTRLERRRAVYRMVLGASEPHWLIDELDATQPLSMQDVIENSLELGAWKLEQKAQAGPGEVRKRA